MSNPTPTPPPTEKIRRTIKRGDIFYINRGSHTGHEMYAGRPGLIVSNNHMNSTSRIVHVVYLRRNISLRGPLHVNLGKVIDTNDSIAACEQVTAVDISRIGHYIGSVSDESMKKVNDAIRFSLSLDDQKI